MMPAFCLGVQAFFYAHHFSLYFMIRLFSGTGYSMGASLANASSRTSDDVLQWYVLRTFFTVKTQIIFDGIS